MADPTDEPATGEPTTEELTNLGDGGKKALEAERKARRDAEAEVKKLTGQLTDSQQQHEKALADAETASKGEIGKLQHEVKRLNLANQHGITGDYLDLLVGADEADLEAKAQKVAALIKAGQSTGPVVPSQGDTPPSTTASPEREFLRDLLGKD